MTCFCGACQYGSNPIWGRLRVFSAIPMRSGYLFRFAGIPHTPLVVHTLGRLLNLPLPVGLPFEIAGPGITDLAIAARRPDPLQEWIAETQSGTQQIAVVRQSGKV